MDQDWRLVYTVFTLKNTLRQLCNYGTKTTQHRWIYHNIQVECSRSRFNTVHNSCYIDRREFQSLALL